MADQQIFVPDIGDYSNVEVIEVPVKPGDSLKKDGTIITLETDKATMDIPAPMDLTINQIHIKPGDRVSKGSLMATVSANAVASSNHRIEPEQSTPIDQANQINNQPVQKQAVLAEQQEVTHHGLTGFSNASPGIRKLARELGVDLSNVSGTGKNARISEDDVKHYVYNVLQNNLKNFASQSHDNAFSDIDFSKWGEIQESSLSRIKKKSGQRLHKNWLSIPHVTHFETADLTELDQFRNQQQQVFAREANGGKLTPLAFFIKAVIKALKHFPNFNSSLSANAENLIIKHYYNIGIAVNTEGGLVVPIIKSADQKNIFELAKELITISQRARENKLTAEDLQGGSFTISSLGGIGGCNFTPIINAPEVAILGISRSQIKPCYINGQLCPRLILPLALSYDHRVIDGAEAAQFSKFIVQQLEDVNNFYE